MELPKIYRWWWSLYHKLQVGLLFSDKKILKFITILVLNWLPLLMQKAVHLLIEIFKWNLLHCLSYFYVQNLTFKIHKLSLFLKKNTYIVILLYSYFYIYISIIIVFLKNINTQLWGSKLFFPREMFLFF